jgi:2Fe-2S ferredoxin
MPRITYIEADGRRTIADLTDGSSVMELALDSGVEGIEAECGGCCACATCHCYVEAGGEGLAEPGAHELSMLETVAAERLPNSRLACQLSPAADLTVRLPERQR